MKHLNQLTHSGYCAMSYTINHRLADVMNAVPTDVMNAVPTGRALPYRVQYEACILYCWEEPLQCFSGADICCG